MNKLKKLMIASLMMLSVGLNAQSINGTKLEDIDAPYIEIVGRAKFMSNKISIFINYGQATKFLMTTPTVTDSLNNIMFFNSMIDVLNYFAEYGYELSHVYSVTNGNQNVYHWLIKKKKD
jgi:hypothetical protein